MLQLLCRLFQVEIIETKINDLLQYINNAMDMTRMVNPRTNDPDLATLIRIFVKTPVMNLDCNELKAVFSCETELFIGKRINQKKLREA